MRIFVTGGAGYVGSLLVPALLDAGHEVRMIDWFLYGDTLPMSPKIQKFHSDLRSFQPWLLAGQDAVIHLACVSNDPSFELDPGLGKSINYDATKRLVDLAKAAGVKRLIYASSSSVYGVKPEGVAVTENLELQPLTDYSKYKALAEEYILGAQSNDFEVVILRPATLYGYSPRLRLDLVVNALTASAYFKKRIVVHGGQQWRANLDINDMVRAYLAVLDAPAEKVNNQIFNVGGQNLKVLDIATRVQTWTDAEVLVQSETNDPRSYTINSERIANAIGFRPTHGIRHAILDLIEAFDAGKVPNVDDPRYYNIQQMQACHIS